MFLAKIKIIICKLNILRRREKSTECTMYIVHIYKFNGDIIWTNLDQLYIEGAEKGKQPYPQHFPLLCHILAILSHINSCLTSRDTTELMNRSSLSTTPFKFKRYGLIKCGFKIFSVTP